MFGRRKRKDDAVRPVDPEEFVDDLDEQDRAYEDALLLAELEEQEARPSSVRPQGPWDAADAPEPTRPQLDLGGIVVPVPPGAEVRVDVGQDGAVVAATLVLAGSAVQVNAFAAPRSEGIWSEVLDEIAESLSGSGGSADRVDGTHGPELRAVVPTQAPDGRGVVMAPARFAGVDGPRWFLRALYTGPAATDPEAAAALEEAVRGVVVVRGSDPMAVRDPLPLRLPPTAVEVPGQAPSDAADPLALAERGPEITETR